MFGISVSRRTLGCEFLAVAQAFKETLGVGAVAEAMGHGIRAAVSSSATVIFASDGAMG